MVGGESYIHLLEDSSVIFPLFLWGGVVLHAVCVCSVGYFPFLLGQQETDGFFDVPWFSALVTGRVVSEPESPSLEKARLGGLAVGRDRGNCPANIWQPWQSKTIFKTVFR